MYDNHMGTGTVKYLNTHSIVYTNDLFDFFFFFGKGLRCFQTTSEQVKMEKDTLYFARSRRKIVVFRNFFYTHRRLPT